MTPSDLEVVLRWRNQTSVRRWMMSTAMVTEEEHLEYFTKVFDDTTRRYLVCVDAEGAPRGLVNFRGIDAVHLVAEWGFYSGDPRVRGVGRWLGLLGLDHAFDALGLEKLVADVLEPNTASLHFHAILGFTREGVFRAHHVHEGSRVDVHRFGILRAEWAAVRPGVQARLAGHTTDPTPSRHNATMGESDLPAMEDQTWERNP